MDVGRNHKKSIPVTMPFFVSNSNPIMPTVFFLGCEGVTSSLVGLQGPCTASFECNRVGPVPRCSAEGLAVVPS